MLAPSTITFVDAGSKTTSNLCRNCHGGNYGVYVTLSQFSVPAEVEIQEVFTVSVRMVLSGNLDQNQHNYWLTDTEVTLSSDQNHFSFSPATYTYNDKVPGDIVEISWQLTADQGVGIDTLTVSVYAIAQHFSRTGSDQLSAGIEVMPPNTPPQLSQAAFSPSQGDVNQLFDFEVVWSDADGDMPSYLRLIVDGTSLSLSEANPSVADPVSGVRFVSSSMTLSAGHHTYFFQGSDGGAGVRLPAGDEVTQGPQGPLTGVYPGPFVGSSPTLVDNLLSPLVGNNETEFTYSITLAQGDDMNGTGVIFWLDGADSGIQPVMTDLGALGWRFDYTTKLTIGVNHFHHFTAVNQYGSNRNPLGTESLEGPIFVDDVLSAASISPTQGDETSLYTFSINYSNPAEIAPESIVVVIDGIQQPLSLNSSVSDWSVDNQFTVGTLLSVGNHSYHFEAVEDGRNHRIPGSGELQLEVIRFDSPPWLANSSILIGGNEVFNDSSVTSIEVVANLTKPVILTGTEVELRVTFFDAEDDAPANGSVIAWVDGIPSIMQKIDDNNASEGQFWSVVILNLPVGVNHTVQFTAMSNYSSEVGEGERVAFPIGQNIILPLPNVEDPPPPNVPPIIKPPSDGRMTLDPFAASVGDNYTFLIEVVDADWTTDTELTVWLELDGVIHNLEPVNMTDHQNGTIFGTTLQLTDGEHLHRFGVSDAEDEAAYPAIDFLSGPTVQANMIPVDEIAARQEFVSWAWWLVFANILLIFGGVVWTTVTFRKARGVVYQRKAKKLAKVIREFDEKVELEKEIIAEKALNDGWKKNYSPPNIEDEIVESTVDSNKLIAELGDGFAELPSTSDFDDLLDEMDDNESV
jgi:hypothetical protein